jgi:hypothetical protein
LEKKFKGFYPGINVGGGSPKRERGGKALDEPGPTLKGYHDEKTPSYFSVLPLNIVIIQC